MFYVLLKILKIGQNYNNYCELHQFLRDYIAERVLNEKYFFEAILPFMGLD